METPRATRRVKGWTDTHLASAYHFFFQSGFFECLPASTSASACEISSRDCGSGQDPWTGARFSSCFLPDFFDGCFFSVIGVSLHKRSAVRGPLH